MGSLSQQIPVYLEKVVSFPDGRSYEITRPLTDMRKCHDGRPLEARIVFVCKEVTVRNGGEGEGEGDEFVMKVKVQAQDTNRDTDSPQPPVAGPSTTTQSELRALEKFTSAQNACVPHLVSFKTATQGSNGIFPGGYLSYMVMTKMPGLDLLAAKFWGQSEEARKVVVDGFLVALRSIYALGIEPVDCALRNILWEPSTQQCSIIDFELWRPTDGPIDDEKRELERWGLAKRKVPISWWAEWNQAR